MTDYAPPSEELPIFDVNVFLTGDEPLTFNQAKKKFLRYPNAQGTENLQAINVNGIATFEKNIIQNGTTTNIVQDITTVSNVNKLRPTDIYGDLNLRRPVGITGNGGALRLWDVSAESGFSCQIYDAGTTMAFVNLNNGGNISFNTRTGGGGQTQPLQVNSNDFIIQTSFPPTQTAVQPVATDSSTKIPTTAWVQSAITASSGSPNLTKNSLTIFPNPSISALTGINNYYNLGAKFSQNWFGGGGRAITIDIVNLPSLVQTTTSLYGNDYYSITVNFSFFQTAQTSNWSGTTPPTVIINKNSGTMQLFPTRLLGANPTGTTAYGVCRINNSINGNTNFSMYDASLAPYGRPYWCSDFNYSTWTGVYNTSTSTEVTVYYQKLSATSVKFQIVSNSYTSGITYPTMTNCTAEITGMYFNNTTYPIQAYFS